MTHKHTPAPWEVQKRLNCGGNIIIKANATEIAAVFTPLWGYDAPQSAEEAQANARLIAASPQLYDSLKGLLEEIPTEIWEALPQYIQEQAINAINKAEAK